MQVCIFAHEQTASDFTLSVSIVISYFIRARCLQGINKKGLGRGCVREALVAQSVSAFGC